MKKLLLNALFMGLVTLGFAQPTFTEKTLTDMRQRMLTTTWDKFSKEEVSPDFVMQGDAGKTCDMPCMDALNASATLQEWPMEQIKIKQVGNVAIVTGITHHAALFKNGAKFKANQRFTETYEYKNGKWLWSSSHYTNIQPSVDMAAEEAAIKKVIEKETQSWHNRDAEGRIACIANVPYGLVLVHHGNMANNNGVAYATNEKLNAPEALKAQTASMGKPNGSTFKNENYVVTIKGGTAFVNYTEVTTAADGTKQYSHSVRNLEKIDGLWKLTYIGGVFYKP